MDYVAPRAGAWIEMLALCLTTFTVLVAPRAGAWIEIWTYSSLMFTPMVAPRAGAWIEMIISWSFEKCWPGRTSRRCVDWNSFWHNKKPPIVASHLTQVRGLKYYLLYVFWCFFIVAPHAGAWIEIVICGTQWRSLVKSHLTQVRGFK